MGLSSGRNEDRTDYAPVEACCSNDAATNDSNKDAALADQLQHCARTKATPDPFNNLVCIVLRICFAQCAQNDRAYVVGVIFKRRADSAFH